MDQQDFQEEVIDRLARIETKQDTTNGRVTKLEKDVDQLKQHHSERNGVGRFLAAGAGFVGGLIVAIFQYFFHH